MNVTIEYRRTVRVREYETLTIGWTEEFDPKRVGYYQGFENVKRSVDSRIDTELRRLRAENE